MREIPRQIMAGVCPTLLVVLVLGAELASATTLVVQTFVVPMRDRVRLATKIPIRR